MPTELSLMLLLPSAYLPCCSLPARWRGRTSPLPHEQHAVDLNQLQRGYTFRLSKV